MVVQAKPKRKSTSKTLDVPAAAELLGVSSRQAYHLIREGEFPVPVLRLGRRVVVPTAPLLAALGVDA